MHEFKEKIRIIFNEIHDWLEGLFQLGQDLRNCHNGWLVGDTRSLIITLKINQSVTAPYEENVPVA